MPIYLGNHLVDISSEEYIYLSDEEKEKILKEGYAKKSQIVRFLVKKWKNARSSVYRWLKQFEEYVPLREIFRNDRELYVFLVFREEEKAKKDFINLKDVAQILGISYRHAKRLLKQGKIMGIKIGREYRVLYYPENV